MVLGNEITLRLANEVTTAGSRELRAAQPVEKAFGIVRPVHDSLLRQ
jgi:hypothetical protein